MLAKDVPRIEGTEAPGLFRSKKVQHLRLRADNSPTAPPHVAALIGLVRAVQADGGKIRDLVARTEKEFNSGCRGYNHRYVVPALVALRLIEE